MKKDRQTFLVPKRCVSFGNRTAPSAVRQPVNWPRLPDTGRPPPRKAMSSMAESVFEAVKQSITVREAAQMYGIEVNRSDMACCPFHDDKNPSMKLNEEYFSTALAAEPPAM